MKKRLYMSLLLTICMISTYIFSSSNLIKAEDPSLSNNSIYKENLLDSNSSMDISSSCNILDYINETEFYSNNYIHRITEQEALNTYVFQNIDGSQSTYVFDENIKYVNEIGETIEKDLTLIAKDNGFTITKNDVNLFIPNNPNDGIQLNYLGHIVTLTPLDIIDGTNAEEQDNSVIYKGAFGTNTSIKYTPLLSGVKEDIIITEYIPDVNYRFSISSNGLYLFCDTNGYYLAQSESSEAIYRLGEVIIYDAIGKPSFGTMNIESVQPGTEYIITISADSSFLSDPSTVYPVTIDPSLTVSDNTHNSNAIEDSPIFSGKPSQNFGSFVYNRSGTPSSDYGKGRTVIRLSGLLNTPEYQSISSEQITNVSFFVKEASGNATQQINLYPLTSNTTWTENSVTWNNVGSYSTDANYGNSMTNGEWTSFDITNLVQSWKKGIFSANAGFIMINQNESNDKCFFSSEYSTSSLRPYVVITYTSNTTRNSYYSRYDPSKFNNYGTTPEIGDFTNLIQYRMNCYGYALCNILTGSTIYSEYGGYKQQPGEFAQTADKGKTVDNIVLYNPAASMSNIISNMKLDATRLGYTITEYIPSSSTVTQFGSSSRLIALVTGAKDYHFYMQHNDGTWSHKPGSGAVTNKSLANNSIVLTNSNIIARANEGAYSNGSLKFFVITKSAIIDHPHGTRCCTSWPCSHSQSSLFYSDKAGDYLQTSVTKYTGNTSARMDFAQDHDVYCFTPTTTKTYTISTTCSSDVDIDCKVYNASGSMINSSTSTGQVNLSISLTAGQTYYFDIYNYNQTITGYTFTIN